MKRSYYDGTSPTIPLCSSGWPKHEYHCLALQSSSSVLRFQYILLLSYQYHNAPLLGFTAPEPSFCPLIFLQLSPVLGDMCNSFVFCAFERWSRKHHPDTAGCVCILQLPVTLLRYKLPTIPESLNHQVATIVPTSLQARELTIYHRNLSEQLPIVEPLSPNTIAVLHGKRTNQFSIRTPLLRLAVICKTLPASALAPKLGNQATVLVPLSDDASISNILCGLLFF
jgi:hypothetical protein